MKAESFTTEWLLNQKPARRTEIADRGERSRAASTIVSRLARTDRAWFGDVIAGSPP